ncbi:hypothetical protein B0O80DRAFT_488031 [Mortierella sp. GBAus27b]|nr:hypothetical protein B0O80DRAFT_488031 [Mortierella sp. GBAus27b]
MVEAKEDFNKLLAFTGFECDAQNPPPFTTSDSRQEKRSRARAEPVPIQPKSKVRDRAIETDRDRPLCNEFSAVHPVDRDHTCQQTSRIDAIFLNGMLSERIIKMDERSTFTIIIHSRSALNYLPAPQAAPQSEEVARYASNTRLDETFVARPV